MSGTQALFTSPLKKCFLETLATVASLLNRRKAFQRSSSLSCGQDGQSSPETRGNRSPTKLQPFSTDPFGFIDPCEAFWVIPSGQNLPSRALGLGITQVFETFAVLNLQAQNCLAASSPGMSQVPQEHLWATRNWKGKLMSSIAGRRVPWPQNNFFFLHDPMLSQSIH